MTAIMAILTILAIMTWFNMALNMVIIGVYGKIRKSYGQIEIDTEFRANLHSILVQIFNEREGTLRMLRIGWIFFCAYIIINEWDKCVAEKFSGYFPFIKNVFIDFPRNIYHKKRKICFEVRNFFAVNVGVIQNDRLEKDVL